ncbi:peptidase inhibitor family I36 protein [Streptomyces graminifolii]|uniref:peptidase inhibitor family I36 protein n=1 Tax=Streptomyces graminifolii TaxID=1266771 RepID=UPI00405900C3
MTARRTVSVLGLATTALLAFAAGPALAQPHNLGRVEMFNDINYSGYNVTIEAGASRSYLTAQSNDQVSSLQNWQDVPYCFYSGNDYTGAWLYVPSGYQIADLRSYGMNDVISSFRPANNTVGNC